MTTNETISGGVVDLNKVDSEWLDGMISGRSTSIDLGYAEHKKNCSDRDHEHCEWEGRVLFGKWKRVREYDEPNPLNWNMPVPRTYHMVWAPDATGPFAAIYNRGSFTVQVVWSRWTQEGRPCSPCYPGQISLLSDTTGVSGWPAYSLPPEAFDAQALKDWGGWISESELTP